MKMVATLVMMTAVLSSAPAGAQENDTAKATAVELPAACKSASRASNQPDMMQKMQDMHTRMSQIMESDMHQDMMSQLNDTQKGLHEAMMRMNKPMMSGMMAKDADVAWICAMIPHHQGAIDMARAGLLGADNEESRRMAEETIATQEREIAKLVAWVEQHGDREIQNEKPNKTPQ
ncbi:DUF305 domain-containing protein [Rhodoligotrophos ferricapiens]|uniref:DUF305 domain-containing protein n=1 Tax=Rhodoligotrophos ferricapiens TaxID=3069264 RepID=UPI00315C73D7